MRPRFKSILAQIIWLQVIACAVTVIAVVAATYLLLNSASVRFENASMHAHAATIQKHLHQRPDGTITLDLPSALNHYYAQGLGGFAYAVSDDAGRVLFSSDLSLHRVLKHAKGRLPAYYTSPDGQQAYIGLSVPVEVGNRALWVQVSRSSNAQGLVSDDIVIRFLGRIIWFAIPIIVLILVIDVFVMRRLVRPLAAASDHVQHLDPKRLDVRLPTDDIPDEVLPLVQSINAGLDRVAHGFLMQRNFTADAAHELRTPLTVLRMRIDALADREAAKPLRADAEAMAHVVDQLLAVAELETASVAPGDQADLHRVCSDAIALIAPLALAADKEIALIGEEGPVPVHGNAPMLSQAVRNLVENAVKHTAGRTTVEVDLDKAGIVRVLDKGPGIAEADRERIFQRFWRRDRTRPDGAGLGLSIVARVAELHGGHVTVADRPEGGAMFTLDLSAAALRRQA